jgi:hypothetical protein
MASGNDMKAHETTYSGFMTLLKWTIVVVAIVTVVVVALIA